MAYTTVEGRQELLDALEEPAAQIGAAVASLGAAYEQVDDATADRLEAELFEPAQAAYARIKRTYTGFAGRHGLASRAFAPREAGLPSTGAKGFIDDAIRAAGAADGALAGLQDSPKLVEVGDVELRAGVAEVRELVGLIGPRARGLERTLGR